MDPLRPSRPQGAAALGALPGRRDGVGRHPVPLPVILLYSSWSGWGFRGKARADIGYR